MTPEEKKLLTREMKVLEKASLMLQHSFKACTQLYAQVLKETPTLLLIVDKVKEYCKRFDL